MQGVCVLGDGTLAEAIRMSCTHLTAYPNASMEAAQIVWCAWDTPIREDGHPDTGAVLADLRRNLRAARHPLLVIMSSQVPVGTCRSLIATYPQHRWAVVPENIRVSHGLQDWRNQERIIVGVDGELPANLDRLLRYFTPKIITMSPESAEVVKHGLNAFLALSVAFGNELGRIAEQVGANPMDVAIGITSDSRVGERAYLRPGGPFGAHLRREVLNLMALSRGTPLIDAIEWSNTLTAARTGSDAS